MKLLSLASLTAVILAAGCNGTVVDGSGGSAGSGGSGGSAGQAGGVTTYTTTPVIPPECAVSTNEEGPFTVAFHFINPGASPLYLRQDCSLNYSVTSCDKEYTEALALSGACTIDCSDMNGCVQCGACLEEAVEVVSGQPHEDSWGGLTYTFGQTSTGCPCHTQHVAPAQKYRITVPVFASQDDAMMNKPMYEVSTDFDLPAPNAVVDVVLQPAP